MSTQLMIAATALEHDLTAVTRNANAKTPGLYYRRNDDVCVGEVERIGIW
jgi:predicted nucleic acid-binding protein